jgi:hypothetical protein
MLLKAKEAKMDPFMALQDYWTFAVPHPKVLAQLRPAQKMMNRH